MDPQIQALALQLAEATVRNTAGRVVDRITAARARKRDDETIVELEEIINDLISDKAELVRVAQAFEEVLVAQRISTDEVAYITDTIIPVIKELVDASSAGSTSSAGPEQVMELAEKLLSANTVNVLQLLGFNFKRAIGEPLTELVSQAIRAKAPIAGDASIELQRLAAQRELALFEVSKDPEAYERLARIMGR